MTRAAIEAALETALAAMALPSGVATVDAFTAWRNRPFTPVTGKPYQRVSFLYAEPDNPVFGPGFIERGYLQIDLFYPIGTATSYGPNDARTRGELLRTTFARGSSFTASGTTVMIDRTPTVSDGMLDGDRYRVMVKIRFYANQF
jgi:hypothetical protein